MKFQLFQIRDFKVILSTPSPSTPPNWELLNKKFILSTTAGIKQSEKTLPSTTLIINQKTSDRPEKAAKDRRHE